MTREPLRLVAPHVEQRLLGRVSSVVRNSSRQVSTPASVTRGVSGWRLGRVLLDPTCRGTSNGHSPALSVAGVAGPSASVNPLRGFPSLRSVTHLRARQGRDYEGSRLSSSENTSAEVERVVGLQPQVARRHRSNCVAGAVNVSHARTPVDVQEQPGHAAPLGRMRPKRERRATHLLPVHDARSANGHFSFAAVRSPAQAFLLQGARFRTPSPFSYRVEAAGIEPASAAAPAERLQA